MERYLKEFLVQNKKNVTKRRYIPKFQLFELIISYYGSRRWRKRKRKGKGWSSCFTTRFIEIHLVHRILFDVFSPWNVGMWDALQGNQEKPAVESVDAIKENSIEKHQFEDAYEAGPSMPVSFGGGRGGRGSGRGDGRDGRFDGGRGGRGRGLDRDMKGKDWECPSCTNVNWSWRTNCNKCNTAKPAGVVVGFSPFLLLTCYVSSAFY